MRVKTDAKRREILIAAAEVFREHGFAGASMSAVSERAGGSKATLYRYFASKEDLFVSLMLEKVLEHAEELFDTLQPSDDLRRTLVRFGASLLELRKNAPPQRWMLDPSPDPLPPNDEAASSER